MALSRAEEAGRTGSGAGSAKPASLLSAAAAMVAAGGTDSLSIRRLAAEVGTSTMAVYTWYGNKPNLLRAVYREAFSRFGDRLRAAAPTADPLADLWRQGLAYRDYALAEPNLYQVMFGPNAAQFEPEAGDLEMALGTFTVLVEGVRRCVEAGGLTCVPEEGAWQIWAAVHGAISLELLGNRPGVEGAAPAEAGYLGLARTVLIGLGADAGRLAELAPG
jgi:AcrR family transcriptional regulator